MTRRDEDKKRRRQKRLQKCARNSSYSPPVSALRRATDQASLVLVGSALVLGSHWLSMGLIVATGATLYVGLSIALSLNFVSPAARLSNAQDTLVGGSLAEPIEAVACGSGSIRFGA